mmetsp:Transcript_24962/g.40855  ORF Transcript_24962/g.40855 Transcript_24962/m.40855 type:complete len:89 (+) Transcript_24962:463-729(+)
MSVICMERNLALARKGYLQVHLPMSKVENSCQPERSCVCMLHFHSVNTLNVRYENGQSPMFAKYLQANGHVQRRIPKLSTLIVSSALR